MNPDSQTEPSAQLRSKAPAIKVFGVGNAGVNFLQHLIGGDLGPAACVAVNSDASSLAASSAGEKICLETKLFRGLGTGGDPERGRAVAEEQMPKLKALCAGARTVLIVSGLGGGAGTGMSPVLAAAAKSSGALVLAFVVLPFECEGTLRAELARAGLERLRAAADLVICVPNQKALTLIDETTSLKDTFKTSDQLLANCLGLACRALAGDSVMGLPFSDLCLLIRQRSADCTMAVAEATGPNRAVEVVESLLAHPVLGGVAALQEARAVGVCVLGGPSLTMVEVNRTMEQVQRQCQGPPVMMGASVNSQLAERLLVALLAARPGSTATAPASGEAAADSGEGGATPDMGIHLLDGTTARPHSRFVPPPPTLSPEKMQQLRARHAASTGRSRHALPKLRQSQLPLEIVSKGRFDKSEPTIHKGEDLDMPTYIRRGVALN